MRAGGADLESSGGDVDTAAAMINLYHDIQSLSATAPYLGVGVGVCGAQVTANNIRSDTGIVADGSDTVLAWQATAGFNCRLVPSAVLYVEARYFATGHPTAGKTVELSNQTTDLLLGARFP